MPKSGISNDFHRCWNFSNDFSRSRGWHSLICVSMERYVCVQFASSSKYRFSSLRCSSGRLKAPKRQFSSPPPVSYLPVRSQSTDFYFRWTGGFLNIIVIVTSVGLLIVRKLPEMLILIYSDIKVIFLICFMHCFFPRSELKVCFLERIMQIVNYWFICVGIVTGHFRKNSLIVFMYLDIHIRIFSWTPSA